MTSPRLTNYYLDLIGISFDIIEAVLTDAINEISDNDDLVGGVQDAMLAVSDGRRALVGLKQ